MDVSTVQTYVDQTCTNLTLHEFKACQISHTDLSHQHTSQLEKALRDAPRLRKLDVINCPKLRPESIDGLCSALMETKVSHLSLESVELSTTGLASVTRLLDERFKSGERTNRIKYLSLDGSIDLGLTDIKVWNEFVSVACRTLDSLDLSRINLSSLDYVVSLADAISDRRTECRLLALILSNNPFGDDGFETLCRALKQNRTLILLACGECNITYPRGVLALTDCVLSSPTLQRLYMYGNLSANGTSPGVAFLDGPDSSKLRYWLELNGLGRAFLQQEQHHLRGLLPLVLSRVSDRSTFLYGLLREASHVW